MDYVELLLEYLRESMGHRLVPRMYFNYTGEFQLRTWECGIDLFCHNATLCFRNRKGETSFLVHGSHPTTGFGWEPVEFSSPDWQAAVNRNINRAGGIVH